MQILQPTHREVGFLKLSIIISKRRLTCASIVLVDIIALAVIGELRDIEICGIAATRAKAKGALSRNWNIALGIVNGARRYIVLPGLLVVAVMLVPLKGGDALNVCLNTLAILFLLEVDNASYAFGLSDDSKGRVEV